MEKGPSLKSLQLSAIYRMLALNADVPPPSTSAASSNMNYSDPYAAVPAGTSHNQWKVLIYDKPCRSIISPLLSVSQLRSRGVTLHLLIESDRESIPDVPAVYFVEPTRANLQIIASDCAKRLYGRVHINFATKLDRDLMEEFARLVVQSNCLDVVSSVHDQYLDFVCYERNLFSLSSCGSGNGVKFSSSNPLLENGSYAAINGAGVTEQVMEKYMEDIAYGLFSVVGTTGTVPVIRCPKGGAPEMVARKLTKLIAEHPNTSSIKAHGGHNRPILVILDRNMDLITPLQHTSTYQALIDDLLEHNANRVEFTVKNDDPNAAGRSSRPNAVQKKFDLDADVDPFYVTHKFNPFPEAIESNGAELQEVTSRETAIRSKTNMGNTIEDSNNNSSSSDPMPDSSASDLANAVDSLPSLLERKKQLEIHTSILQAVMNEVASRDVPQFYELESDLATGTYKNDHLKAKKEVLKMVMDITKGNIEDKVRLVAVYCLATTAPGSDVSEVVNAMVESIETKGTIHNSNIPENTSSSAVNANRGLLTKEDRSNLEKGLNAIEYIKNLRSMQMIPNMTEQLTSTSSTQSSNYPSDSTTKNNSDMLLSFMARATNQATGLLAKATEKVGSMLGKINKNRATRIIENLCERKPNSEDEEYLYLDPKVRGGGEVNTQTLKNMVRAPVRDVLAFVIGGGCYAEYQNLQMLSKDGTVTITYGSTEILSPVSFLSQLGKLS